MNYLDLPAHARSSGLIALANACGARMEGSTGEGGSGGSEGGQGGSGGSTGTEGGQGGTGTGEPVDVASLPSWAQEHIRGLRTENAGHRQRATAAETAKSAAEQKLVEQQEAAKVALGLAEAPNAEQLAEQLRASQAQVRQAQIDNAVILGASSHGADAAKLRNRVDFVNTVGALDPSASDFASKVSDAIKTAVEADETVRVSPPAGEGGQQNDRGARRPAPDRSQASGGSGGTAPVHSVQTGRDLYRQRHGKTAAAGS